MKLKFSKKLASIITACSMCVLALTACGGSGGTGGVTGAAGNITSEIGARYESECITVINEGRGELTALQNDAELAKEALSALNKIKDGKITWGDSAYRTSSGEYVKQLYVATDEGGDRDKATLPFADLVNATELSESDFHKLHDSGSFAGKSGIGIKTSAKYLQRVGVASRVVDGKTYVAIVALGKQS